jgi:hypothetical protein
MLHFRDSKGYELFPYATTELVEMFNRRRSLHQAQIDRAITLGVAAGTVYDLRPWCDDARISRLIEHRWDHPESA